jgi:NAD(P)-dependent dehydrogenase (short-subunit alcohol dehydrogenase family)
MRYTIAWAFICAAAYTYDPLLLLATLLAHLLIWVALVGGPSAFLEVLNAHLSPKLPPRAERPGRRMLVIGAARGLGQACVAHARRRGWEVHGADAAPTPALQHVDLTQPRSIRALCARLRDGGVRVLDALLLVAGVCDAAPVAVPGSPLPRMLWANFLGHACVVRELEAAGVVVRRVVLVSSGSYSRGGRHETEFFPRAWTPLGAMAAYAQSKFLATAWAHALRGADKPARREVAIINPGPMRTQIGDAHVPLLLWPTYGLMKEVLFPPPAAAAAAVVFFAEEAGEPPEYVDIRAPGRLAAAALSVRAMKQVRAALDAAGICDDEK